MFPVSENTWNTKLKLIKNKCKNFEVWNFNIFIESLSLSQLLSSFLIFQFSNSGGRKNYRMNSAVLKGCVNWVSQTNAHLIFRRQSNWITSVALGVFSSGFFVFNFQLQCEKSCSHLWLILLNYRKDLMFLRLLPFFGDKPTIFSRAQRLLSKSTKKPYHSKYWCLSSQLCFSVFCDCNTVR